MSNEAVSIPPNLAAEMTAYDPTSGELRTHYAGFFDPGFGFDPTGGFRGSRAALEVRAHDVPFMVENGQAVCKLTFERMLEEPTVALRVGHRVVVSATRRDAEPLLPPITGVAPRRAGIAHAGSSMHVARPRVCMCLERRTGVQATGRNRVNSAIKRNFRCRRRGAAITMFAHIRQGLRGFAVPSGKWDARAQEQTCVRKTRKTKEQHLEAEPDCFNRNV